MCGIAGYINLNECENSINEMLQCLSHRGPDDLSILKIDNFIGGMVRLSINDLEKGAQPLYNSDKSVVLFYNGEIYNSPQLRKKLESKGYIFRTRSDGEVICHLYDEYGHNLFSKLDGMFAIALYDTNSKKLYLARDYPGEKPLYYCNLGNGRVIFASELKSIIRHSKTPKNLDYQSIWDFPTFLFIPDPNTIFKNVKSLERGNIIETLLRPRRVITVSEQKEIFQLECMSSLGRWDEHRKRQITIDSQGASNPVVAILCRSASG